MFKIPTKRAGILPPQTEDACLCQTISCNVATVLRDSVTVTVIVIVVVRTRPQAIPLAMLTMRKSTHGFPFLSYIGMACCLAALWATRAPLQIYGSTASSTALRPYM